MATEGKKGSKPEVKPQGAAPTTPHVAPQAHGGGKASAPSHTGCKAEGCKKSFEKFGFCMEHYEFYMAGVIRGDGKKPIDYEQKLRSYFNKHPEKKVA